MTNYHSAVADYLAVRRGMGYKLAYQGQMLAQFADYLHAAGAEHLTIQHAVSWAKQPQRARPSHGDPTGRADPRAKPPGHALHLQPGRHRQAAHRGRSPAYRALRRHLPDLDRACRGHRHPGR
jgi:hypothetical protein